MAAPKAAALPLGDAPALLSAILYHTEVPFATMRGDGRKRRGGAPGAEPKRLAAPVLAVNGVEVAELMSSPLTEYRCQDQPC
jgi:hypothetical protein